MRRSKIGSATGAPPATRTTRTRPSPRSSTKDIYFTGAITDPAKTDLVFSYEAPDGRIRQYTLDFVIRAADDRWLLVETKSIGRRDDPIEGRQGRKARTMQAIADRNPGHVTYRMVFADTEVDQRDVEAIRVFQSH